jgi:anhydro-N-acetylmuramic acid kinase
MKKIKAIGLMSGTSLDGIDLSLIESDGLNYLKIIDNYYEPYDNFFKEKLFKIINNNQNLFEIKNVEKAFLAA